MYLRYNTIEKVSATLIGMAIVAKFSMLLKAETKSLDDTITVDRALDLIAKATSEFLEELSSRQAQMEKKPKAEA